MRIIGVLITGGTLLFAACGGGGGNSAKIAETCKAELNTDEKICDCIGEQAQKNLSKKGQAFVLAALKKDHDKTRELRKSMEFDEITNAATFLTTSSTACALQE